MKRKRLNELIAGIKAIRAVVTDEQAVSAPGFFREWKANEDYVSGERVQKDGTLYTVLQDHTSQDGWLPNNAPSLYAEVLPGQGGTEIGEWVQPDSTNPYMTGDRVIYNGQVYESRIDNNIWSPEAYPAGWTLITG